MTKLSDALLEITYSLIPAYGRDDFDEVFELNAGDMTVGDQYKIRNELLRLCEPCEKIIDLRGEVNEKCKKFVHKGRIHYLDALAQETFEHGLLQFGQYTVGIWEDVNNTDNNFRVRQARLEQERLNAERFEKSRKAEKLQNILATELHYSKTDYPAHVIRFGDYFNRGEERMNYSVQALLKFEDGRKVQGVTRDLSLTGLYLRVGLAEQVELEETLRVVLSEQLPKYATIAADGIEYQVKRIECIDNVIWLGLNRTYSESEDLYSDYVRELIACNKIVYKVNLDHAIDAALKQGHEQVFFARNMTMGLFVDNSHGLLRPRYTLTSGPNEQNLVFFADENNRQHLPSLFNNEVLRHLTREPDQDSLLFCFSHKVEGQSLYFAAFSWQFEGEAEIKRLFTGYGSKKDSWRVFRVRSVALNLEDANTIFALPDKDAIETVEAAKQDKLPAVDIGNLTHAIMLTEVANSIATAAYRKIGFDATLMANITRFQISFNPNAVPLHWVKYGLDELRHEPRFAYKTKLLVKFANGMQLECTSVDFSARGVQVSLPKAVEAQRLDIVGLTFPLLQKITKQLILSDLQYRIMRTANDQKTLFLQAVEQDDSQHHGVRFFKDLIKRNQHKLTLVSDSSEQQRLTRALKNLLQKPLVSIPFYVNRVNNQLRLTKLVNAKKPHPLLELLKSDEFMGKVNIQALMQNDTFDTFIKSFNKVLSLTPQRQIIDLYIGINGTEISVKTDKELVDPQSLAEFVNQALGNGEFYCMRAYIYAVQRVQLKKIADELEYIHHYAQHKAKFIAESLVRINSVGELVDITTFVLDYLQIEVGE